MSGLTPEERETCACTLDSACTMPGHDALRAELTPSDRGDLLTTLMLGGIPDAGHVRAKVRPAVERIKAAAAEQARAEVVALVRELADGPYTLINDCGMPVQWVDPAELRAALATEPTP